MSRESARNFADPLGRTVSIRVASSMATKVVGKCSFLVPLGRKVICGLNVCDTENM